VEKIKACNQKLSELKKYENIIKKKHVNISIKLKNTVLIQENKKKPIKIDTPFPNEISSFGCTLMCRLC
jgi:hypothetical protein